ncbi:MAG TPA: hypothetical protein VEC37_14440, partial [Bacillota bacterium]|nr:hypothetical protein [Bacillota bacterium]
GIYERAANKYSLEMGCIIKYQSEQLLSIQYIGVGYVQGGAYPNNLFYTTNINIKNASRIRLKDLVNIDKKLVEVFLKGRYTVWDPELNLESEGALDDVRMSFNTTSLIKYFNEADLLYQNSAYVFSYFTKGALGISIGVPHAIGDHVEFEILYRDIPDSIKTKSAIWNDL